ncbi:unnamed protein product [Trichogramma brassicae]|uniref:Uncharacterized protein n=1 Tax=Trichogramma brassicae TaxID=86971 RepID=A0A6H5J405_9HYME|nr:unnamed protein product [Trichogramma brassicae]CAB0044387.1 unnamed protein product [Trichogramma brassicae]
MTLRASRDQEKKFLSRRLRRAATWRRITRDDVESQLRPGGELSERMMTTTRASREREEKFSRRRSERAVTWRRNSRDDD